MTFRILCCCVAAMFLITCTHAQSFYGTRPQAPLGALPFLYNGGFAGEAGGPRISSYSFLKHTQFSDSWPGDENLFNTGTYIGADHFFKKMRSGVGVLVGQQGNDFTYRNTNLSATISPKFSHRDQFTFAPFATLDFARLQLLPDGYFFKSGHDISQYTASAGFLINSQRGYIGLSVEAVRWFGGSSTTVAADQLQHHLQAGYTFQKTPQSNFSFTPQLLVSFQHLEFPNQPPSQTVTTRNRIALADLNLVCRYKKFIGGINLDGVMLGYQNARFKLQVTNFYWDKQESNEAFMLGDSTYIVSEIMGARSFYRYSGSLSMRYLIRKGGADNPGRF
ncbi:MAG TPA: hypothetical protein VEB86_07110 [Chryseosolibacter sp.]|nr:hypothetical protein [Chryseosolibacter sp.]